MAKINVLPKSISELIAAGEVVERPSSVVKELTENAIDAGATQITVEIKKGGAAYIRVSDNGCGIEKSDVPTAFLPHATSKIRSAEDLDRIFTLGFRGEALPSIAAVAKVSLLTRTEAEETGASYVIEGGQEISFEEAGCPKGATIVVRELFFNTPARRKFLKKDVTEGNFAADAVTKTALSHPEIRFTFIRDEKRVFTTPGNGDLFAAVYAVFGKEVTSQLLPCEYEYEDIRVSGYISAPLGNRPNRSMQYFFVNGRYVRIPAAAPALDRAYKNSIMIGKFPMCFLSVELPFDRTDVNVHPAKTEIRFSEESKLFEAVFYAARSALSKGDTARPEVKLTGRAGILDETTAGTQMSFAQPPAPEAPRQPGKPAAPAAPAPTEEKTSGPTPAEEKKTGPAPQTPAAPAYAPPRSKTEWLRNAAPARRPAPSIDIEWSEPERTRVSGAVPLNDDTAKRRVTEEGLAPAPVSQEPPAPPARDFAQEFKALSEGAKKAETPPDAARVIGEAFSTYIIAEWGDKLILIDKHAAHERMIFNSLSAGADSQMMLMPLTVTLSGKEYAAVVDNLGVFADAGYEIEDFGGSSVIVRACPLALSQQDIAAIVREMAGKLAQGDQRPVPEKLDWLLNSTACRAAIKAGDDMKPEEMEYFVRRLLQDETVRYCPHGRPVLYEIKRSALEKQFGRAD